MDLRPWLIHAVLSALNTATAQQFHCSFGSDVCDGNRIARAIGDFAKRHALDPMKHHRFSERRLSRKSLRADSMVSRFQVHPAFQEFPFHRLLLKRRLPMEFFP